MESDLATELFDGGMIASKSEAEKLASGYRTIFEEDLKRLGISLRDAPADWFSELYRISKPVVGVDTVDEASVVGKHRIIGQRPFCPVPDDGNVPREFTSDFVIPAVTALIKEADVEGYVRYHGTYPPLLSLPDSLKERVAIGETTFAAFGPKSVPFMDYFQVHTSRWPEGMGEYRDVTTVVKDTGISPPRSQIWTKADRMVLRFPNGIERPDFEFPTTRKLKWVFTRPFSNKEEIEKRRDNIIEPDQEVAGANFKEKEIKGRIFVTQTAGHSMMTAVGEHAAKVLTGKLTDHEQFLTADEQTKVRRMHGLSFKNVGGVWIAKVQWTTCHGTNS